MVKANGKFKTGTNGHHAEADARAVAIERLEVLGFKFDGFQRVGDRWEARCPAHGDRKASLAINLGRDGGIVMTCHAGCTVKEVLGCVGLTEWNLFAGRPIPFQHFDYQDANGDILFQVVRFVPKSFIVRRPGGNGGWVPGFGGVARVPYHLPEVIAADKVYVTEGEGKCDRLRAEGVTVTCFCLGAGKWKEEYAQWFKGKHAIILIDNDEAGRRHGDLVASKLYGVAASVKIVLLPDLDESEDVVDWLAAGHTIAELEAIVEETPLYEGTADADANGKADADGHAAGNGKAKGAAAAAPHTDELEGPFRNYDEMDDGKGKKYKVGRQPKVILPHLLKISGGWPKRVGDKLFVPAGDEIHWLKGMPQLFAWINSLLDDTLLWVDDGADKTSRTIFDAYVRQQVEEYKAVDLFPHWPKLDGHYYHHPEIPDGNGEALKQLLDFYHTYTPVDRSLITAALLTLFCGIAPGQRPAFLIEAARGVKEGSGRGTAKSAVAKTFGLLVGGHFDASPRSEFDKIVTRLLSPQALTQRMGLLDNVKKLRFSWAEFEALVTTDTVGGHEMYKGDGQRPNFMTWFITLNGATLSKDMAQRTVPIRLNRPDYVPDWEGRVTAFIKGHRWEIIGDILALLKAESAGLANYTRWAAWEHAVLSHVPLAEQCQKVIAERQEEIDSDQEDADFIRAAFLRTLRTFGKGIDPDKAVWFIKSEDAAQIYNSASDKDIGRQTAVNYVNALGIRELRKVRGGVDKLWGFRWTGSQADPKERCMSDRQLPELVCDAEAILALFPNRTRAGGRFRR
jgi:hypothetical protein